MTTPRRHRGQVTPDDAEVWRRFAHAVTPLRGRPAMPPPEPAPAAEQVAPAPPAAPPPLRAAPLPPVAVGAAPGGLDRASWERLRAGRTSPERTLDLHGRTAERAHRALRAFIAHSHAEGLRCVEVITGRGAGEAGGVLRRELPEWLNAAELRPLILAVVHPHTRNTGAVRILLRRRRT